MTLLVDAPAEADGLHAVVEALNRQLAPCEAKLRENLAVLAVLHRGGGAVPALLAAVEGAGVPVHHLAESGPCLLLTVNDSQYRAALFAAYNAQ